ncbi:MAG: glycosyltransferase family A protein, partial [Pyrodictiaceae archaeon]
MTAYRVLMSNMDAINPHVFQEYGLGFLGVLVLVTWSIANIEFTLSLRLLSSSRNNAKPLPTITSKPISIIILADNNSKRLQKLLEATRRVGYPLNKVIVIDYGDSDEGFSVAKRYSLIDERIHALKFERNSPSRFREELELERIGAAIAAGSDLILVFLRSNIVIAEPKTLLRLVMTYTNKSTVVLYMPRLICLTAGCKILNGALGILLYALIGIRRVYSLLQKSIPRYCCWSVHSTTYWKLFEFKEGSYMQDRYKNRGKWGQDSARLVLVDGGNAI